MRRTTVLRSTLAIMTTALLVLGGIAIVRPASAQSVNKPGHKGPIVSHSIKNDVSPALRTIPGQPWHGNGQNADDFPQLKAVRQGRPNNAKSYLQTHRGSALAPTASNNFPGVGNGFSGPNGTFTVNAAPPDTNGAVGPQDYVQTVNTDFAVFNKDSTRGAVGTVRYGPVAINTLWSGFGGLCQTDNDGDPTVVYDGMANRWIIAQFAVTGATTTYLQCVAVSTTGDPTGTWNRYSFSYSNFPDYPKMGVWPDAYYETYNMFQGGSTFVGAEACALNRSQMLNGAAATQQCFTTSSSFGGVLPATLDSSTQPPAGAPNYMVALDTTTSLALWKFHVDWTTPGNSTFSGPTSLPVASYAEACGGGTCIPQSGTTQQLDSLADRVMYRLAYRNFGSYESLVVDHAITAGSSVGMRWYEIRSPNTSPTIFQSGTYAPDSSYRWMGSIAEDQSGDMAMGYSVSSGSLHPGISYTGRLVGDPAGQMTQGEASLIVGGGSQTGSNLSRWGDYSAMTIDPADGCTFWYTNEYIPSNGAFNWKTQIGSFKFPSCGGTVSNDFSISANPTSLSIQQGNSGTSTISTAVTSGSAGTVSLTASVSPAGPTVSLNPTSVTAGGSSTLTVNVGSGVATGNYTVTVTGTEGSNTHSTSVSVTVTAPATNDFSISASPTSLSIQQGANGTSTISTAVTSGSAGTVSLTASVSPAGPTASLNPTSVTAGGSSTLTVSVGASVATGNYTVTVTGTEGSAIHSASVTVTVTAPATGGITNGGFETGTFSGWTTGGQATSISATAHSGSHSGQAGSSSPTNGDSTIAQTFTVPSGMGTLSVWYQVHCPDTVTYDWATITLKDNTSGTTTTMLGKTCTNSGAWVQVSTSVTAGHSDTLTLLSHDDNYAADPTYTLFDDAALSAPVSNPVVNPGFETGTFSGWTTGGQATSISATAHSGSHSGQAGSSSPTNGDSTIAQTFTIPTGATTLGFWYRVVCPDTVTYDWATVTLKDNTTGTTTTVLAKTCTNTGSWVHVSTSVTAGHSVTLTLISHDDNYATDPTYTLYDDVAVS
ncbi:MAG TPA: hypothetical protein VIC85_13020 [Ktedonobacterales bacterium]